ncbi:MAG: ThiF family adenylyltransferase [Phycisphaerales bacterium]|nr:ThiF family adenylyltransferase [Phycisphaerales bacterium]
MPKKKPPSKGARARVRNPPTLQNCRVAVVGLNALGYRIAQLLVSSGVRSLKLFDHRLVTKRDQLREGYDAIDVGRPKAHAAVQRCHEINARIDITGCTIRTKRTLTDADVIFVCSNACRCRHGESGSVSRMHIHLRTQGDVIIDIESSSTAHRRDSKSWKSSTLNSAEAFIVASVAVQKAIQSLAGAVFRKTHRIRVDGQIIQVTKRASQQA